jgi:hypothetical protein
MSYKDEFSEFQKSNTIDYQLVMISDILKLTKKGYFHS